MKAQNNMNVVAVYKNVNNFTSYMFIIGFLLCAIFVWQTHKRTRKRVELMASYTTKHVSCTTVTMRWSRAQKSTHINKQGEREKNQNNRKK